ncbi:transposase [Streptomyces actuosus]|uniref:Transposase n=1 Tax=Streptomyces actuosus TaxID=1885 RepID=A0ABS2W1J2_STRAS|nr:transposase [Streptomyces actuosus]
MSLGNSSRSRRAQPDDLHLQPARASRTLELRRTRAPVHGSIQEPPRLAEEIEEIFQRSGGTYGSPKVFVELVRRGWRVSVNTVAKAMAELGLAGRKIRRRRSLTRPGKRPTAPDFAGSSPPRSPTSSGAAISQRSIRAGVCCTWRRSSIFPPAACWATRRASGMMRSWWRRSTWPRPPAAATYAA